MTDWLSPLYALCTRTQGSRTRSHIRHTLCTWLKCIHTTDVGDFEFFAGVNLRTAARRGTFQRSRKSSLGRVWSTTPMCSR